MVRDSRAYIEILTNIIERILNSHCLNYYKIITMVEHFGLQTETITIVMVLLFDNVFRYPEIRIKRIN